MEKVISFLNIITNKIDPASKLDIISLNKVFKLKMNYNIEIKSIAEIRSKKYDLLDSGINHILDNLRTLDTCSEDALDVVFNRLATLCNLLDLSPVVGGIRICQIVDVIDFTFGFTNTLLDSSDVTAENFEDFLELAILLLAQDIDMGELISHDYPIYPLAYTILSLVVSQSRVGVIELHQFMPLIRIGRNMYDNGEGYFVRNKKTINEKVIQHFRNADKQNESTRQSLRKSKRESFSMFNETIQMPTAAEVEPCIGSNACPNVGLVINCLAAIIQILVLKEETNGISRRFLKYLDVTFKDFGIEE